MTFYGSSDNSTHDDLGDKVAKEMILKKHPEAEVIDRLPLSSESYIYEIGISYDISKARDTLANEVESEKRAALVDETVSLDGIEVWNRTTKVWETKTGVNIITDKNSKTQLNMFALKLAKNSLYEKTNWKNNGDKVKLNEASYALISDAMEIEDDNIFDWVSDKLDEISDATNQAEIEAIDTTYT